MPFVAASLATEGFIHCSFAEQVAGSANRHYGEAAALWLLRIDPSRLQAPWKVEASSSGALFPHIYGPINREAVVEVTALQRVGGQWVFPADA